MRMQIQGFASALAGLRRRRRSIWPSMRWPPPRPGWRPTAGWRERAEILYRNRHLGSRRWFLGLDFGDAQMLARKQALAVTDAAAQRIQALLSKRGKPSVGVRGGVRSRGCSGL